MVDFENVAAIRGAKLSDLAEHVKDVLALVLAPEDEYQVGKLALESYDFVPYALSGLAAAMQTPAGGARASTHVTVPISDDKGGSDKAAQDVTLFGPGDVLGVDPAQIARRYPTPGSTNAEETFHAHIEFDRPELPWAFSAHTVGDQMPPWLALVVFELDEVEWEPAQTGLQPVVSVDASVLPPLASAWAWAHAQATSGIASLSARLSTAYAPVNVSRLLAARVLTQDANYVACLVPTTDVGRRAGLGLSGGTLGPAWTPLDGTVRLPVFDRWEFRTAPDGDFARLARRLKGVAAPWEIGRRIMDASRPGDPLADLGAADAGRRQVIKCALFSPAARPPGAPDDAARWSAARTQELKDAVERPAVVEGTAGKDPGVVPDLPIIGPRIYAKGQRGTTTVPTGDWFADLNLAPTNRVVGGLGTRVVAKDQEELMQAAWAQVGEIEKTNRELALAELARNLAHSLHARLAEVEQSRLLQLARPLASRVRLDGAGLTLAGQIARSATPDSALRGAFRRSTRTTGPIARRLGPVERTSVRQIVGDGRGLRDFTRQYVNPDGIGGLSDKALQSFDPAALSAALDVPAPEALAAIKSATTQLARADTLATAVTTPAKWREPDMEFRPGVAATERIASMIRELAVADRGRHVVTSRWLGGLAAGLAVTQVEGTAELHEVAVALEKKVAASSANVRVPQPPIVARDMAVPSTAARMLRSGAGRGAVNGRSELSGPAAGALLGSINRHVAAPDGDGSERERLDRFRTPQATVLATWAERAAQVSVLDVRAELSALIDLPAALALAETPQRNALDVRKQDLLLRLDPNRTVVDAMRARLDTGAISFDPFARGLIRPIMAAPRFDRPMYEALDVYDREWLVPGLGKLPEPDLVTVLAANDEFIESFLVGLSDEMGRELLWREYPTDARGTYFYRFWEPDEDELSEQIHRFAPSKLGSHVTLGPPGESGIAVVVIRGEVVRRYPDLTVMALHEQGRDGDGRPNLPEAPTGPPDAVASLFHAFLPPDIMLAGLDITVDSLRQPGWWIVLAEHPQATRFRRQEPDLTGHEVTFATAAGNATGATVARDRLEDPTRIAFEAGDFLPPL
ncbi:MAG: hypothetical protein ABI990_02500 [Actinomycetota bacterium]